MIKTNTEELQEILQTVYNLPNASGGSTEPDLVITYSNTDLSQSFSNPSFCSFDNAAVIDTYNKLLAGQTVNCVLNSEYWIHSGHMVKASSPHITTHAVTESNNSARVGCMIVYFKLWHQWNPSGLALVEIEFDIHSDDSASIRRCYVTRHTAWSSGFL